MYPDLDEIADGLLAFLGIAGRVTEPSVPTDGSGMIAMQHYDIPKSLSQLQEILRRHNREMRTTTSNESGQTIHSIWVRQKVA